MQSVFLLNPAFSDHRHVPMCRSILISICPASIIFFCPFSGGIKRGNTLPLWDRATISQVLRKSVWERLYLYQFVSTLYRYSGNDWHMILYVYIYIYVYMYIYLVGIYIYICILYRYTLKAVQASGS